MNSSLSRELSLLNLGEPAVAAKFVYGRFVADESVSEPTELDTTDPTRYVELLITTPKNVIRADEMPSALITETNFLSGDFSLITIDGSKTPNAFIAAVSSSLLLLSSDRIVGGQSKKEITKSLDNATPDHVTTLSLNSAISTLIPTAPVVDSQFNNASKAIARSRINSRIVHDITSKIATNTTSPGAAAAAAAAAMTKSAQNAAINAGWIQNQHRLKAEYGVDTKMERLPYIHARWVTGPTLDPEFFERREDSRCLLDRDENPVILFKSDWALRWAEENYKDLQFLKTAPVVRR
jgi:hypothetical protein